MKKKTNPIDTALNEVNRRADEMANYDDNYEDYDGDIHYDEKSGNFVNPRGVSQMAPNRSNVVVVKSHQNPGGVRDRAQFDINITRLTAAIASPLPVAIFGTTHLRSGYSGLIVPPVGATLVVVGGLNTPVAATTDRIRFTYTSGANVDSIDVTCNQVPYPVFLAAMEADVFRISNVRYTLVNAANTIQFSQLLRMQSKSLFGKEASNDVSVAAYKRPEQFQTGIIDIPLAADIDKETLAVINVSELAVAYPFTITLSVFVEKFRKHDRISVMRR